MNRLLFIYFENLPGFEPFCVNLSNQFSIDYKDEKLHIALKKDFYGGLLGDHIDDINVIAGENGVGKSTLLKAIAELLTEEDEFSDFENRRALLVYQTDFESLLLVNHMDTGETVPLVLGEGMNIYRVELLVGQVADLERPIIYYSPFLDFNPLDVRSTQGKNLIFDISQTALIMEDLEHNNDGMDMQASIFFHKSKNSKRQISFVNESRKTQFPFPFELPETIDLVFNRLNPKRDDISTADYIIFDKLQEYCALHFREYPENNVDPKTIARLMFLRNLLSMYFLAINANKTQQILHHHFAKELEDTIKSYPNDNAGHLVGLLFRFFDEENIFNHPVFINLITVVFNAIEDEVHHPEFYFLNANNQFTLRLNSRSEIIGYLYDIMSAPGDLTGSGKMIWPALHQFISLEWRNFSSGEKMFVDLFSRLSSLVPQLGTKDRSVLILLDEAEMGFHPSWQLRYAGLLCLFFDRFFSGYQVQIIMAIHSPLVLSDFPKERVHLFRKSLENGQRYKAPPFGTFAQNVTDLLANDFFIDTALVGDVAKAYVDKLLDLINAAEGISDAASIAAAIEEIDEPLIRQLLSSELERKQQND